MVYATDGSSVSYTYDSMTHVDTRTDRNGDVSTFGYNAGVFGHRRHPQVQSTAVSYTVPGEINAATGLQQVWLTTNALTDQATAVSPSPRNRLTQRLLAKVWSILNSKCSGTKLLTMLVKAAIQPVCGTRDLFVGHRDSG